MTVPTTRGLTVTEVRLTPVLVADPPLLNTQGVHQPYTPRLIVEIVTADGTTGVGETYGDTEHLELAHPFAERLKGRQIADVNGLFTLLDEVSVVASRVENAVDVGGLRGVQTADKLRLSIASAFEVASLGALGKALGLPVHALLGGKVRDAVEYSAYLFCKYGAHPEGVTAEKDDWGAALDPAGVVAQARAFQGRYGFTSFKLKGGVFPPEEEIAAARALAEAFPGHPLRLDLDGAWSRDLGPGGRGGRRAPGAPGGPDARHPPPWPRSPRGREGRREAPRTRVVAGDGRACRSPPTCA